MRRRTIRGRCSQLEAAKTDSAGADGRTNTSPLTDARRLADDQKGSARLRWTIGSINESVEHG